MEPMKELLHRYTEANVENLSTAALIVTVVLMSMMLWTFSAGSNPVPEELIYLLWVVVAVFTTPKEIVRWKNGYAAQKKRLGQVLVFIWLISLLVMGYLEWKNPARFQIPEGMGMAVYGILVIFGASTVSRKLHKYRKCDSDDSSQKNPIHKLTENQDTTL